MAEHRVPQWHPLEALLMIGQAIDGMLDSAMEVVQSLEQARPHPHVLDDFTIGRVREAHGTQCCLSNNFSFFRQINFPLS